MNRQQKSTCLIIILIIMLLGIGAEAFQTGSSFLCTYSFTHTADSHDTLQKSSVKITFTSNLFILEGIRQSCHASSIRQSNRKSGIRTIRTIFPVLALFILLLFLLYNRSYIYFYHIFDELLCSMLIVSYIHLSDGKKPRYSYLY